MAKKTRTAEPGKAQHGHKRTLKDAAFVVLEAAGKPLSIPEITAGIISHRLYKFNTATPSTVVSHAVRRNCKGLESIARHTGRGDFEYHGRHSSSLGVVYMLSKWYDENGDVIDDRPDLNLDDD